MHAVDCSQSTLIHIPANSPGFPRSLKDFHQISREIPSVAFFKNVSLILVIFEMSKRKTKQQVDMVLLFELFLIGKPTTE